MEYQLMSESVDCMYSITVGRVFVSEGSGASFLIHSSRTLYNPLYFMSLNEAVDTLTTELANNSTTQAQRPFQQLN